MTSTPPSSPTRSEFQLLTCVITLIESGIRDQAADDRIGRDLGAAVGAHDLAQEVVAGERADVEIRTADDVEAGVDAAIERKACRLSALSVAE